MKRGHFTEQYKKRLYEEQLSRVGHPALASVIERNIASIASSKKEAEAARGFQERLADRLTRFFGNVGFVYVHVALLGLCFLGNSGIMGNAPFDPYPYGLLTLALSIEAIFLTVFVLISENRQAQVADRRADLDLQINLLAEYEITRILLMTAAIAEHLDVDCGDHPELQELVNDVEPQSILKEIDNSEKKDGGPAAEQTPARERESHGPG